MIRLALLLTLFAVAPVAAATPAASTPIEGGASVVPLLDRASTPGTRIRLFDLVPADRRDAIARELLDIDLGRSPSPGFERRLTREAVRSMLPGDIELVGAAESLIRTDVTTVTGDQLLDAALAHVESKVTLAPGAELEVTRRPHDMVVPRGRDAVVLAPRLRGNVRERGPIQILVDLMVDGKLQASVPVAVMARIFRDVPVLAHDLARGARLTEADVTTARLELTRTAIQPISDLESTFGRVARRNLRVGDVVADRDFERPTLVRRNEPVTMVFTRGLLRAETFGIARESGSLGDPIRIENLTTRKIVVGRIVAAGLVQMNPRTNP